MTTLLMTTSQTQTAPTDLLPFPAASAGSVSARSGARFRQRARTERGSILPRRAGQRTEKRAVRLRERDRHRSSTDRPKTEWPKTERPKTERPSRRRTVPSTARRRPQGPSAGLAAEPVVSSAAPLAGPFVSGGAAGRRRSTVRAVRRGVVVPRGAVARVAPQAAADQERFTFAAELIGGLAVMTLVLLAAILA